MEKTKTFLSWAIIIAVLMVAGAFWSYAKTYSRSIEPTAFRSFSVSGQGKVVTRPDVALFSFSVINEGGTDIAALNRANTERGNQIISFLKEQGVAKEDIETTQYNLSPRYQNTFCNPRVLQTGTTVCPPPSIVGYTVTQALTVKVRDFAKIGEALAGVVSRGANNVSQLNFTIDNPVMVENEAREKAIAEARAKAKLIAKAGGFGVGRLLGIDEGGVQPYYAEKYSRTLSLEGAAADMALPAPSIEPGSQEVLITVTLRYEID